MTLHVTLDGTETLDDLRESMTFLAHLKRTVSNHAAIREIDRELDALLDAELRIKAEDVTHG